MAAGELRSSLERYAGDRVGRVLVAAKNAAVSLTGAADLRSTGYLAPLFGASIAGVSAGFLLEEAETEDVRDFSRVFGEEPRPEYRSLVGALDVALAGSRRVVLRDVMRFAARQDPLARDYASGFEIVRDLCRPALLASLSRGDSSRGAVVQSYIETLAETPDMDIIARAGTREAEDVSRMARGVVKVGGVHSRRGLEGIANLDGILREDPRLAPTATEPLIVSAAYLVGVEHGAAVLGRRVLPTGYRNRGR